MFIKPNFGIVHANELKHIQQGIEGLIEGHPDHYSVHVLPDVVSVYPSEIRQDRANFIESSAAIGAKYLGRLMIMHGLMLDPDFPVTDLYDLESVQKVSVSTHEAVLGHGATELRINYARFIDHPEVKATSWQYSQTIGDGSVRDFGLVFSEETLFYAYKRINTFHNPELLGAYPFADRYLAPEELQQMIILLTGKNPDAMQSCTELLAMHTGQAPEDELRGVLDFVVGRAEYLRAVKDDILGMSSLGFSKVDLDEALELIDSL